MKRTRVPLKKGFVGSSTDNYKSRREHIDMLKVAHEINKAALNEIMKDAPKVPYAKCFDHWVRLTPEQAESMKNDITIVWK